MEKLNYVSPTEEDNSLGVAEPVSVAEDIDPGTWLVHHDSQLLGEVEILVDGKPRKLKIAAITEKENLNLLKMSRKFNPKDPKNPKIDFQEYRLLAIAHSLGKANPGVQITTEALKGKKTGELTKIQVAIFKLSGLEAEEKTDISDFFA